MKIQRVYVEKQDGFNPQVQRLQSDLESFFGARFPELAQLKKVRILNRYDVSTLDAARFEQTTRFVLSDPGDTIYMDDSIPVEHDCVCFAVEYLPGQYDQRADSARQCAALVTGVKPDIRCAQVYILYPGGIPVSTAAVDALKKWLINPVEARETACCDAALPADEEIEPAVDEIPILHGFSSCDDPEKFGHEYGLAMSADDLNFCRDWFSSIGRDPTLAEMRVLDTYWSDHCRHSTFNTIIQSIDVSDGLFASAVKNAITVYEAARDEVYGSAAERPRSLMDMAQIGAKVLKKRGLACDVDESKEINACTVKTDAHFSDGSIEPWFLLFKNETHNHPTEIEPVGGAGTCLGGAIRDPLSGRAYVYQAMRITGAGDPRQHPDETLPGKLPQVKLAREASAAYASYGNQAGVAAGQASEFYHDGFLAKRMEMGALVGAVPQSWVRREEPVPGDVVILVGGKTGRDGIGGATSSSKAKSQQGDRAAGAEVPKGDAVTGHKLQRLYRNPNVSRLIKRSNDFGAGGVSVAVGEIAAGLDINLDNVPAAYSGLNGIELAISESQERMAVVVAAVDSETFIKAAACENLEAVVIAEVTAAENDCPGNNDAAVRMTWRGKTIVDLKREFLNSNGAPRYSNVRILTQPEAVSGHQTACQKDDTLPPFALLDNIEKEFSSLRSASRRGMTEIFDSSAGASSVLFPWGGAQQGTPECGMAALLPSLEKQSVTASIMSFGYDPHLMEYNPYEGAKGNIREALAKFACLGGNPWKAKLSFQEYFQRLETPELWGKPAAALLGALEAQLALGVPAIGGKDSMSGNYRDPANNIDLAVPPSLIAFAAGISPASSVRSGALSGKAGNVIVLFAQKLNCQQGFENAPASEWDIFKENINTLLELSEAGCVCSAYPLACGGLGVSLALMAFGNNCGLQAEAGAFSLVPHTAYQGSILAEIDGGSFRDNPAVAKIMAKNASLKPIAATIDEPVFRITGKNGESAQKTLTQLRHACESPLCQVYPQTSGTAKEVKQPVLTASFQEKKVFQGKANMACPLVVVPVFPGVSAGWDMERAFCEAKGRVKQVVFRNRTKEETEESIMALAGAIDEAQILSLTGGFSAIDDAFGSGRFIANALRCAPVFDAVNRLLERGLILGISNGFSALLKLGLLPYGVYRAEPNMPVIAPNNIGRHVSRMVRTRVMSVMSPWLSLEEPGAVHVIPVSHCEGRIVMRHEEGEKLFKNGQVPFCYAGKDGQPCTAEPDNPNGSDFAIEGITSPDGRILGKMGHSERHGKFVHVNIPGNKQQNIFRAGVRFFA